MKKVKYLLFSLLLIIPLYVYAAEQPKVTKLTTSVTGKTIKYDGETETTSTAVMCKIYDSSNKELKKISSAVSDSKFNGEFTVEAPGTYKVSCANYSGGTFKDATATVVAEKVKISTVNITLNAPIIGEEVTVSGNDQTNTPVASSEDNITIEGTSWIKGIYSEIGDSYSDAFTGTFEADKYYYAGFEIAAKDGYTLDTNLSIKVNGEAPAEVFAVYNGQTTRFIAKIKAVEKNETPSETKDEKSDSPKTGDKFIMYVSLLSVGLIGCVAAALIYNKKVKKNN